jgi:hypothetical protein
MILSVRAGERRKTILRLSLYGAYPRKHSAFWQFLVIPTGVRQPANSPSPLTRHFPYHCDKLSLLALTSELVERHSPCGIRSLAEGGRLAPGFAD